MSPNDFLLFTAKCAAVTFCIGILLSQFYPKYEFLDATHRVNKISGKSEYYSTQTYNKGWHE